MSRKTQDIPIRPRYGITDEPDSEETEEKTNTTTTTAIRERKSSASICTVTDKMSSSYSEIPFLAQYAGVVPPGHTRNDVPSTSNTAHILNKNESVEEEDDESAEDHSKSSSGEANKTPKRPDSLQCESSFPYELEGATSNEGEMRHFVADNLEEQLRTMSPTKRDQFDYGTQNSTPSGAGMLTQRFLQTQTQTPQIDPNVLSDIEIEAQYLATSVDNLTENLCNLLHSISSITADNVEVHKNAVNKLTDCMDANIKCMYTIMAKTEEITKSMKPTEQLGQRIREIKRLVDMLENTM